MAHTRVLEADTAQPSHVTGASSDMQVLGKSSGRNKACLTVCMLLCSQLSLPGPNLTKTVSQQKYTYSSNVLPHGTLSERDGLALTSGGTRTHSTQAAARAIPVAGVCGGTGGGAKIG